MALVACGSCARRVSDRAPCCPFCKAPLIAPPSQLAAAPVSQAAPTSRAAPLADVSAQAASPPAPPSPAAAALPAAGPPRVALAAPYRPGDAIGEGYRVLRLLGEGGFGLVYLAVQRTGGAVRAVKTVRDELVRDEHIRALFRKEAEIWVALGRHPFLVEANQVFEDDGRLFIAMEFVAPPPGGFNSLHEHLQRRPLPLPQALRWAVQCCHGMEHAYGRGIRCHRDLKPANILIGPDDNVRLSDFGIAGVVPESVGRQAMDLPAGGTIAGTVFGTPTHMPPEQFDGVERCDERSDVYAFGVVLYQMVTGGALPFLPQPRGGPDAGARLFQDLERLHREAPPPRLDSPLWPVIERCLRKDPAQRYPRFAALRAALEPLLVAHGGAPVVVPTAAADEAWELASRATSLSALGRLPEAIAAYEGALALLPDEPRLLSARGNALRRLGRLEEAHQVLDRALERAPERDEIWLNKGLAWVDSGRAEEALRCFEQAVARNARSNDAWTAKGVMLSRLGRPAEALAAFDAALEADPRDARAWSNKAGLLLEAGRLEESLACSEKGIGLDPGKAAYWDGHATTLGALGRLREALLAHDEAVRLDPQSAQNWYNRGNALVQAERHEDALDSFERACSRMPQAATPWYNRALCLLVLERAPEALACLRRYLGQAPADDSLRRDAERLVEGIESGALTHLSRSGPPRVGELRNASDRVVDRAAVAAGVEQASQHRIAHAAPGAHEIPLPPPGYVHRPGPESSRHPSAADVGVRRTATGELNGRGATLYGEKRYADALACFDKAIGLDPFHARARGNRANALFALDRRDEALTEVRQALRIEPGLVQFWHSKAHVELALGQLGQAAGSFREFVALAQGADHGAALRDAQAQLQKLQAKKVAPTPRDALAWAAAGCRHGADGRFREAIEAFDRGLKLEPGFATLWRLRGDARNLAGEFDDALASFDRALAIEPRDAEAWHGKGLALARQRRLDDALAAFDEALRQDPDHAATWADRGRYLGAMKRLEESIASIECASLLAPENPAPWFNRALAEEQLGWLPEAARSYRRFLERATPAQAAQIESARDRIAVLPAPAPDPPVIAARLAAAPPAVPPLPSPPPTAAARSVPGVALGAIASLAAPMPHTGAAEIAPARAAAQAAVLAGDRERAVALLQAHLAQTPGDGAAWRELAVDLRDLGRLEEALEALEKAQPLAADAVPVLNDRGAILLRLGRPKDALLPLQMASLVSDLTEVWINLGRAYQAVGEPAQALLVYDGVRGGDDLDEVQQARTECLLRLGRPAEALAAAERALTLKESAHAWYVKGNALSDLKRPAEAVAAFDRALTLDPNKANAWYNKAHELFHAQGRAEEAIPCCRRAWELYPRFTEAAQLEGRCLEALGRFDEALVAYDRALVIDPRHVTALNNKGLLLQKRQRFVEAVACFDAMLVAQPGHLTGLFNKGECLEQAGQTADAAAAFSRYLALAPASDPRVGPLRARVQGLRAQMQDAASRPASAGPAPANTEAARAAAVEALKKARFCLGQGQRDKALEWFDAVLRVEPSHADALAGKGECLLFFRRATEALAAFEGALAMRPQHGKLWQMKGACLELLGRNEDALAAFERAVECDPQNPVLWNSRGVGLAALGRNEEAIESFLKALAIEPRSPLPKFELGKVFERLARRDEAIRAYQQFLALAPVTLQAQVQEARGRLQGLRS